MKWQDTLLTQTFVSESENRVKLIMQQPRERSGYELILDEILPRVKQKFKNSSLRVIINKSYQNDADNHEKFDPAILGPLNLSCE